MDDGTPVLREGTTNATEIENELIRLRTRSGAQLLLHNTEGLAYIINNDGTAWIEFSKDGKIDIYAKDPVSVHTENDFNLRAERDINLEAGRNVNIKATNQYTEPADIAQNVEGTSSGRIHIDAATDYNLVIGTDGLIKARQNIKTFTGEDFLVNTDTGGEIHFNTDGKVDVSVTSSLSAHKVNAGDSEISSIMRRIPTQEPWADHEYKKRDDVTPAKTDR